MKKYIIVSIVVAALFVGGSLSIAKAVTSTTVAPAQAKTMKTSYFSSNVAALLIAKGVSKVDYTTLSSLLTSIINGITPPPAYVYYPREWPESISVGGETNCYLCSQGSAGGNIECGAVSVGSCS